MRRLLIRIRRVMMFAVHFGSPHIVFWTPIMFLSSLLMAGREYGIA